MDESFDYVRRIVPATETAFMFPGTWTPAFLGSALQAWYRADAGVALSGSNVTSWADQSGNSRTLTPSFGTPTFSATGFNGAFPGVSCTNLQGFASTVFNIASNTASFFMVCNVTHAADNGRVLAYFDPAGLDFTGTNTILAFNNVSVGNIQALNNTNFTAIAEAVTNGANSRLGVVLDNVNVTLYLNNIQGNQTAASYTVGGANFVLAVGENINAGGATLVVAEIIMTNSGLSPSDRLSLDTYFTAKWGL